MVHLAMPDDSKKQRPPLARRNSSMLGVELKQGNASMPSIDKLGFIKMLPPLLMLPGLSVVLYGAMAWQTYVRGNTALYDKQYAARNSLRNSAQISDGLSVNSQDREARRRRAGVDLSLIHISEPTRPY